MSQPTRTLALLTLNEIDGVRALIPRLRQQTVTEIVAVDGGSTDGTAEFLQANAIPVVIQKERGRGSAFRIAVEHSNGEDIVFFSPDGNENPDDIPRVFEILQAGADMVIASRFLPGSRNEEDGAALPLRKWANLGFTWVANTLWNKGSYITDSLNGFRGLHRSTFVKLATESKGFTIEYELTIRAMKHGLRTVEFPTIEGDRIGGKTKLASFRTGLRFLPFLAKELTRSAK